MIPRWIERHRGIEEVPPGFGFMQGIIRRRIRRARGFK